jgi:integrase
MTTPIANKPSPNSFSTLEEIENIITALVVDPECQCIFHAGRRGLGTRLRELTGNSTAGQNMLGHTDEVVTQKHYEKALPEEVLRGMKLLEDQAKSVGGKRRDHLAATFPVMSF